MSCKNGTDFPRQKIASLTASQPNSGLTVYGDAFGFGMLKRDGIADFGLVLKSFKRSDLFQIELKDLMSTRFDSISIIGNDILVPSNVALPKQKERYILSINLEKPSYQVQFEKNQDTSLVLIHGQFPFQDVVKGFRNDQPLLKLADRFNILSFSDYVLDVTDDVKTIELNLEAGLEKHSDKITITSPTQFDQDYSFVVVALDKKSDIMLANNLTILPRNKQKSFKVTGLDTQIFSGLIHESFADSESTSKLKHRMSFQLRSMNLWTNKLLGFIDNIRLISDVIVYNLPSSDGLSEYGASISVVEINGSGDEIKVLNKVFLGSWPASIDLKGLNFQKRSDRNYRVDLTLFAGDMASIPVDSNELFKISDFVTRNSVYL